MQRARGFGAGEPHGDIEQADRVTTSREQHDDGHPGAQQTGRADALEQVHAGRV